jgi:hypothetical protein
MEVSGQLHTLAALPPGNSSRCLLYTRLGGLDTVEKRKITDLSQELNPDSSAIQLIAHRYTDWAIPAYTVYLTCTNENKIRCTTVGVDLLHISSPFFQHPVSVIKNADGCTDKVLYYAFI